MAGSEQTCPGCGSAATRKDGRDRRGQQRFRCGTCRRRFTTLTGTPFSGYRFPPDVIGLAVRWYLRFRLSYADVAELLAERGVRVDPSTIFAWVREFAPLFEDAARAHAFLRNLRGGFYDLGHLVDDVTVPAQPPVVQAWAALTGTLLGR